MFVLYRCGFLDHTKKERTFLHALIGLIVLRLYHHRAASLLAYTMSEVTLCRSAREDVLSVISVDFHLFYG